MPEVIRKVEAKTKGILSGEATGHDWYHIKQVRDMALRIAEKEGGDKELIELAALAHDIGDRKLNANEEEGDALTVRVLTEAGASPEIVEKVMEIIRHISFKGAEVGDDMSSLEGNIVQDADRLYALGVIGIARAFAYGGAKNLLIYDPERPPQRHTSKEEYYKAKPGTINHFYEKLLLLKDRMKTKTGREIAEGRHSFMEEFLKRFFEEWDAKD